MLFNPNVTNQRKNANTPLSNTSTAQPFEIIKHAPLQVNMPKDVQQHHNYHINAHFWMYS